MQHLPLKNVGVNFRHNYWNIFVAMVRVSEVNAVVAESRVTGVLRLESRLQWDQALLERGYWRALETVSQDHTCRQLSTNILMVIWHQSCEMWTKNNKHIQKLLILTFWEIKDLLKRENHWAYFQLASQLEIITSISVYQRITSFHLLRLTVESLRLS